MGAPSATCLCPSCAEPAAYMSDYCNDCDGSGCNSRRAHCGTSAQRERPCSWCETPTEDVFCSASCERDAEDFDAHEQAASGEAAELNGAPASAPDSGLANHAAGSQTVDRAAPMLDAAAEMPAAERVLYLTGVAESLRFLLRRAEELALEAKAEKVELLAWRQVQPGVVLRFHPEPGTTSRGCVKEVDQEAREFTLWVPGDGVCRYLWDALAPYYFEVDEEATALACLRLEVEPGFPWLKRGALGKFEDYCERAERYGTDPRDEAAADLDADREFQGEEATAAGEVRP